MPRNLGGQRHLARDFGGSVRFGAAAQYSVASAPAFVTAAGWACTAWVQLADISAVQSVITNSVTAGAPQFRITASRTIEILPRTAASSLLSTETLTRGMWQHVAVTHDATVKRTRLFIDGEIVAEQVGTIGGVDFVQPSGALTGAMNVGGKVSRLRLYGRELTQAEVRSECYQSSGPTAVAAWMFNAGTGSAEPEVSGGAAATLTACTYTEDAPTRASHPSVDWGSIYQVGSSYLALPSTGGDNLGLVMAGRGSFQASMWVKPTAPQAAIDLLRVNTSGVVGLRVQLDAGVTLVATVRAGLDGGAAARATNVTVPFELGRWVHYSVQATISDGASGRIRMYRNGLKVVDTAADFTGQTAIAWATSGGGTVAWLGGGTTGANPLPGWVGDTRIGPAMSDAQLRQMITTGVAPLGDWLRWSMAEGAGASAANTGAAAGCAATLTGAAAWSLEAPW